MHKTLTQQKLKLKRLLRIIYCGILSVFQLPEITNSVQNTQYLLKLTCSLTGHGERFIGKMSNIKLTVYALKMLSCSFGISKLITS